MAEHTFGYRETRRRPLDIQDNLSKQDVSTTTGWGALNTSGLI